MKKINDYIGELGKIDDKKDFENIINFNGDFDILKKEIEFDIRGNIKIIIDNYLDELYLSSIYGTPENETEDQRIELKKGEILFSIKKLLANLIYK